MQSGVIPGTQMFPGRKKNKNYCRNATLHVRQKASKHDSCGRYTAYIASSKPASRIRHAEVNRRRMFAEFNKDQDYNAERRCSFQQLSFMNYVLERPE